METINPQEQRDLFNIALQNHEWEQALHLISELQDDGRFPRLVEQMTKRLDLAQILERDEEEDSELEYEKWSNYRADNFARI